MKPSTFIGLVSVCLAFQYPSHGSLVWNDRCSRAVAIVHCAPLFKVARSFQLTGTETPRPGRARAENAAAVVAPCPRADERARPALSDFAKHLCSSHRFTASEPGDGHLSLAYGESSFQTASCT